MNKLLTYIIALFMFASSSFGQSVQSPIRFTNYTIADGLPSNMVNHIMQDSRGFIWMSTAQALARFDGNNFRIYDHSRTDSNSMPSESVSNCIELKNHELLFQSGNHIWMLNPYNHRQHPPPLFWKSKAFAIPILLKRFSPINFSRSGLFFIHFCDHVSFNIIGVLV